MANILKLDSLDVLSLDMIRITNSMKKIIKISNTEEKLFSWFTYYRKNAVGKPKDLWDRVFKLLVSREHLRFNVAQDMVTTLRDRLNADIEEYHCQYAGLRTGFAPGSVQTFQDEVRKASRIDKYVLYVEMNRAGHAELLTLGTVMDTIWQHQEKELDGTALVTNLDHRDRHLDFARYVELRAKYFQLLDNQLQLSADLDDPVVMAAKEAWVARERDAKEKKAAKQAKKRQTEKARKQRRKAQAEADGEDEREEKAGVNGFGDHNSE